MKNPKTVKIVNQPDRLAIPETMALRNWLYANMRAASERFGYQEWDGPFLETIDLYAAKSGEELVKEQAKLNLVWTIAKNQIASALYPAITKLIASWEVQMQRLLLPARRSDRNYPRAVKIKMSNYARKRPVSVGGKA